MYSTVTIVTFTFLLFFANCYAEIPNTSSSQQDKPQQTIDVKSPAFEHGNMIPLQFTCDGANKSPAIIWQGVPEQAKSVALIADDPDAPGGTFVHWVIHNVPAINEGLPRNVPAKAKLQNVTRQGVNGRQKTGYTGPCPPSGTQRYFLKVYALDTTLKLANKPTKKQLMKAIDGHALIKGELTGKYKSDLTLVESKLLAGIH